MIKIFRHLHLIFLFFFIASAAFAQIQPKPAVMTEKKPLTRILFVFDGSQSMYGRWQSDIKMNIARNILIKVLDSLKTMPDLEVALRIYGHQFSYPPQVCNDTKLEVPFGKDNFDKIRTKLSSITPKGTSPIAYSLEQTVHDFTPCADCRNVIVLITDGIEECGGDPCKASEVLQKSGIALKPFIVGIGTNFEKAFNCVGTYFDASSEDKFSIALNIVITRALNPTTCQVNLLDANNRPTETNINMTFYDNFTGKIMYNYIHTLNSLGLPDTLSIDPLLTYDIVVHTIPPVRVDSIRLNPGTHTIIPVNVPQGYLHLKMNSQNTTLKALKTIVRREGSMQTINIEDIDQPEKYITGTYNLEVLSLPRLYVDDVKITQSHTTTVDIPVPGIAVIQKSVRGYGSLYLEKDGKLEWVYTFTDTGLPQESLVLMPGKYRAVYRSRYVDRSIFTIEKSFEVKSGLTANIRLQD
ncbi:MAG: VWA domain-containing protein [Bacteroidales bacterium]|nr:VWA domain-containing protein [Bacteroidales bacterium]